jgi:hypothetical protein
VDVSVKAPRRSCGAPADVDFARFNFQVPTTGSASKAGAADRQKYPKQYARKNPRRHAKM